MGDDSAQNCARCALCAARKARKTHRGDQLLRRPSARNHTSRLGNGTTVYLNSLLCSAACMMTVVPIKSYPCGYFLATNCLHASCGRDLLAGGCFGAGGGASGGFGFSASGGFGFLRRLLRARFTFF